MSYDLYITISGLCLIAQDRKGRQIHVLMPATGREHRGCGAPTHVPRHAAALVYHALYESSATPPKPGKDHRSPRIHGQSIRVEQGKNPSANPDLDRIVANLTVAAGARVPAAYTTGVVADPVAARITITAGEAIAAEYDPGFTWDFGTEADQELTPGVRWLVKGMDGDTLTIDTTEGQKRLRAIDGRIVIGFFHSPPDELPGATPGGEGEAHGPHQPRPGELSPHFAALYAVCDPPAGPCPIFKRSRAMGVFPFTCLVACADAM